MIHEYPQARRDRVLPDAPPRRCILLVDDSDDTLQPLARLLQMYGFDVRLAHTAAEAMGQAAGPVPVDLIVSDVGLPDRSGTDLMRDVKNRFGTRGIAVTGYTSDEDVAACAAAGFECHFPKPIIFEDLLAAICQLLNRN